MLLTLCSTNDNSRFARVSNGTGIYVSIGNVRVPRMDLMCFSLLTEVTLPVLRNDPCGLHTDTGEDEA